MTTDFAAAMRRATDLTRALNVSEATRVIQQALAGGSNTPAPPESDERQALEAPKADASRSRMLGNRILRPLAEVVRTLKEGRTALVDAPHARHPTTSVPDRAQFIARSFACKEGTRQFKLFVPELAKSKPRGLIVMLHGCKQNADDFAVGTRMNKVATDNNLIVAYPTQSNAANAGACWNWFVPAHQMRDRGEPAILAGLTRELMQEFGLQRDQVFVAGLSAGGAMAAVLLETYPDVFSRAGIHSGLAYRSANDVMSAFAAMRGDATKISGTHVKSDASRLIIFHGDADQTVHSTNARRILLEHVDATWAVVKDAGEANGQRYSKEVFTQGKRIVEIWSIAGAGHAWSGGDRRGSFASPNGPDASAEMARFFLS